MKSPRSEARRRSYCWLRRRPGAAGAGPRTEASEAFKAVLLAQPGHAPSLLQLAKLFEASGQVDHAENFYRRAAATQPLQPQTIVDAGIFLFKIGKKIDSEAFVRLAAKTDPTTVDPGGDFDPFAAQVAALDQVISVSNTTVHMAGALNVPTRLLLPTNEAQFWHWFSGREPCRWYPSVRFYVQTKVGDWQPVIDRVAAELRAES